MSFMIGKIYRTAKKIFSLRAMPNNKLGNLTEHEREMLLFYSQFIRRGDLCFDVGANIGNRVRIFLEIGAQVVAVEPQIECARVLQEKFGSDSRFRLVEAALGANDGDAEMLISNSSTISSLSPEWVQSVKRSGRFADYSWHRTQKVHITTLDRLIKLYGQPAFVKIDVEGFEYQVVRGLSKAIKALSFEFTPEFLGATRNVITHLERLGSARFNYSLGEFMQMALPEWESGPNIEKILSAFENDKEIFGDVYVQFPAIATRGTAERFTGDVR